VRQQQKLSEQLDFLTCLTDMAMDLSFQLLVLVRNEGSCSAVMEHVLTVCTDTDLLLKYESFRYLITTEKK
jgi:hypothetical protein